jgi:hypothetical protein
VRTNAFLNAPVWQAGKNHISAGVSISHQMMHLNEIKSKDQSLPIGNTMTHNTLMGASLSYMRVDSLFNRPVIYSATASGIVDPTSGQHRLTGSGVMSVTVRRTENSTFSVGLLGLLDPSLPIPIIPFISYSHRFRSGLEFSLDPSAIALRKEWNKKNSIALSNNLSGNLSLFKRDIVNLPIEHAFSTLEMKSGLLYERLLTDRVVLTLNGGVRSTFTSKVLEGSKQGDPFITNTQPPVPYFRIGISMLPFWKGFPK